MERRKPEPTGFLDKRLADQIPFEEGDVSKMRANYAGSVSLIDDQIAGIVRVIEERGEVDRTVIAFASDHGEMNGDHGLIYKKTFLNGAVRIPLLVRVPPGERDVKSAVNSTVVELMDLGATFVDLAGGKLPKRSQARSLVPTLEGPGREHRSVVVSGLKKEIMIASTEWRMALNRDGQPYLLIDLQNDPDESLNLVGDPAYDEVLESLFRELMRNHPRLPPRFRPPAA
jgi:choline-sulfatase